MAYTLTNLQDDIKGYTEVGDNVFTSSVLNKFIQNAENRIFRSVDAVIKACQQYLHILYFCFNFYSSFNCMYAV